MKVFFELFSLKKIRGKFFILTTILTVIPMLCLSFAVYKISANKLVNNAELHAFSSLDMGEHYLDRLIVDENDLFNVIIGNMQIQCSLTGAIDQVCSSVNIEDNIEYSYIRNSNKINNAMNTITVTKSYIVSYMIYDMTAPPDMRIYGSYIRPEKAQKWYDELLLVGSSIIKNSESLDPNDDANDRMVIGKILRKTHGDNGVIGFVLLELDKTKFFEGLSFLNPTKESRFFISGKSGEILYILPGIKEHGDDEVMRKLYESAQSVEHRNREFVPVGSKYIAASVNNERVDWSITNVIEASNLYKDAGLIRIIFIRFFLGTIVIGLILANWISGTIRRPLNRLALLIKLNTNRKKIHLVKFDPTDEVGQIGQSFLRMIEENKELHEQVYSALLKGKKAEIQALQAQINPHFLYNTLESLNWLAISRKQFEISEVISSLGKFFRNTINRGNELITVREELEHVQSYIRIQKFRYVNKFDFFLNFEEDLSAYYVPKFILQPIVENCIYHGLKQLEREGTIVISGEEVGRTLVFNITDDGKGVQPEQLEEINRALDKEETGLIYGLKNVHDRLKLRFGEGYGVHIYSEQDTYTTVSLNIPMITDPKEE
ncbi:histidine kinase [Paenibacillus sp. GP183]|uniref:sensor histidine kinase n=1 Tax=Paenibacillus sp. GP183 TaxID=1882751 RepID=UPI001495B537|nr:histidine kinase [Paenibacillus sp. GP183]